MNNFLEDQPTPAYSLYDLFKDINNGTKTEFLYSGEKFTAKRTGMNWTITEISTGRTANAPHAANMTDLHGYAASIRYYKCAHLIFNRQGELIN